MTPRKANHIFSIIQRGLAIVCLIIIGYTSYEIINMPEHDTVSSIIIFVCLFLTIGILGIVQEDKERRFRFRLWLSKSYKNNGKILPKKMKI